METNTSNHEKTEGNSRLRTAGKIAKGVGLAGLTIACPPLGAYMLFKKGYSTETKFVGPIVASLAGALSIGIIPSMLNREKIYDDPKVFIERRPNNWGISLPELLIFPVLAYADQYKQTVIKEKDVNDIYRAANRAIGEEIITFNKASGKYVLNFDENTRFDDSELGKITSLSRQAEEISSLELRAEQEVERLTGEMQKLISEGEIEGARLKYDKIVRTNDRYVSKIAKAEAKYGNLKIKYDSVREKFSGVVDKMNAELGDLTFKAAGEKK